ncbi:hypothetical protein D3C84_1083790 [compost metagenome]
MPRLAILNVWLLVPLEALSGLEITRLSCNWLICPRKVSVSSEASTQRVWPPWHTP